MSFFPGLLSRAPFTLLGMIGLVSITGQFMSLEENIAQTLDAWRNVTRPIWEFLFGWAVDWLGLPFEWWAKDYLSLGTIMTAALFRSNKAASKTERHSFSKSAISFAIFALLWPFFLICGCILAYIVRRHYDELDDRTRKMYQESMLIIAESYVYAAVLIGFNYAFIFYGADSRPPILSIWV